MTAQSRRATTMEKFEASENDRTLRFFEGQLGSLEYLRREHAGWRPSRASPFLNRDEGVRYIDGYLYVDGPRDTADRRDDSPLNGVLDRLRRDLKLRLSDRREHRSVIKNLVGVAAPITGGSAARQNDERSSRLLCVADDVDRVRHARSERRDEHADAAENALGAFSHKSGGGLMATQDEANPGDAECIDERQDLSSRDAERKTTLMSEALCDDVGDALIRRCHYSSNRLGPSS
ncbi:MAG: hypothetical protein ACI9KE_002815 [Polyangiales bacterium]|jgi:hypothetical protein